MLVDFSPKELEILRAILVGAPGAMQRLSQDDRERMVLKLHAAIEGVAAEMEPGEE